GTPWAARCWNATRSRPSRATWPRPPNEAYIVLPTDVVVAPEFSGDAPATVVPVEEIPEDQMGLDIGPGSGQAFGQEIVSAKTVVWNGPMGVFEFDAFAAGTKAVAQGLTEATAAGAFTIVGGGDSAARSEEHTSALQSRF